MALSYDVTGRVDPDSINWDDAACKVADPALFFAHSSAKAIEVCNTCPIKADCRTYAIDHEEYYGVWGGMTETELRRRVREADKKPQQCQMCGRLFDNRFTTKYCDDACRERATRHNKRRRKRSAAIPTDVRIQFSRRSA